MVEEALRSREQKKRLAGYTSYKAASAFTKGTMTFHYIINPASNRVCAHRVDPIIGFDTESGGRQRGSWSAAAKDPRQKVTNQTVRDKASLERRLYGRLPDAERGELQQLIRAELERLQGTEFLSDISTAPHTLTPRSTCRACGNGDPIARRAPHDRRRH